MADDSFDEGDLPMNPCIEVFSVRVRVGGPACRRRSPRDGVASSGARVSVRCAYGRFCWLLWVESEVEVKPFSSGSLFRRQPAAIGGLEPLSRSWACPYSPPSCDEAEGNDENRSPAAPLLVACLLRRFKQKKARTARIAEPPTTPITIPAIAPPETDEVEDVSLADPGVCMTPPVILVDVPVEVVDLAPTDRQDRSFPSTTSNTLLRPLTLRGSFKTPAI
jgi:hypothetical protein